MNDNQYWSLMTSRGNSSQTLAGLVEATCKITDRNKHIVAQIPEVFPSVEDMVGFIHIRFRDLEVVERFDAAKAGGEHNFPGYLANRAVGLLRNALQDGLRMKSVSWRGKETPEMLTEMKEQGLIKKDATKAPLYSVASRCGLEVKSAVEEGERSEPILNGSRPGDWDVDVAWDCVEPPETDHQISDVFHGNIMGYFDQEEQEILNALTMQCGNLTGTARELNTTAAKVRATIKTAREVLNSQGVYHEILTSGGMV